MNACLVMIGRIVIVDMWKESKNVQNYHLLILKL